MKIVIVVSSPMTIQAFLYDQIMQLSRNHSVTVIANCIEYSDLKILENNIVLRPVNIIREISPWNDLKAIYSLIKIFGKYKFDLVYSITPKAGLLAMFAGLLVRIPIRIHIFTGQVWVTKVGIKRFVLKSIDKRIANFATQLLTDSASQMQFLVESKIVNKRKIDVLANGSISGVNLKIFSPNSITRTNIRLDLNIDENDIVFLFLGRLHPDKGIADLVDAFKLLIDQHKNVKLLIVGPDEADMRKKIMLNMGAGSDCVQFVGFTSNPEHYMNAADVLCLPSYREGFGSVVIEAAAVGIPAIGSDIYGIKDAIVDNVTGLLFPARNVEMLFEAMQIMVLDERVRKQFGLSAKQRAIDQFSQEFVTKSFVCYFEEIFNVGRAK